MFSGRFEESVEMCEKAIRLHPYSPIYYLGYLMMAYRWVGRYDESLAIGKQLIERSRKEKNWMGVAWGYSASAVTHIKLGKESDAREDVSQLLKINPKANLDDMGKGQLYKDPTHLKQILADLRKAGVPEHQPSQ